MNCVEFAFDRSRGFGSVKGQFWLIAIDCYNITSTYNIASTTVQHVMYRSSELILNNFKIRLIGMLLYKKFVRHCLNSFAFCGS
jgi:hypothetical protein